jgi:hypothetical protein
LLAFISACAAVWLLLAEPADASLLVLPDRFAAGFI